jgi:hypothetical protein
LRDDSTIQMPRPFIMDRKSAADEATGPGTDGNEVSKGTTRWVRTWTKWRGGKGDIIAANTKNEDSKAE